MVITDVVVVGASVAITDMVITDLVVVGASAAGSCCRLHLVAWNYVELP